MTGLYTRDELVAEATLHAQGLEHQATCQAANKRISDDIVERTQTRVPLAWAIVAALGGVVPTGRAIS